jgi:hypothetical protein
LEVSSSRRRQPGRGAAEDRRGQFGRIPAPAAILAAQTALAILWDARRPIVAATTQSLALPTITRSALSLRSAGPTSAVRANLKSADADIGAARAAFYRASRFRPPRLSKASPAARQRLRRWWRAGAPIFTAGRLEELDHPGTPRRVGQLPQTVLTA